MYRMSKTAQAKAVKLEKTGNKKTQRTPAAAPVAAPAVPTDARRIQVRKSGVHGKGVYALKPIAAGERIIEYVGQVISWKEALERHPHDPKDPNHTFYFHVDDERVIDAKVGGNASRWINHACDPNCHAEQTPEGRVFIEALRDLLPGEELFYDYGLVIDERYTAKLKKEYECRCGSPNCRHTMLAPRR
jgi:SET domain-containing protein